MQSGGHHPPKPRSQAIAASDHFPALTTGRGQIGQTATRPTSLGELEFCMSSYLSPCPILESFVRNVQEDFPKEEPVKVTRFAHAISHTPSEAHSQRARKRFEWAFEMADGNSQSDPKWREIKPLGLRVRCNSLYFFLFVSIYQLFMSTFSVVGCAQAITPRNRRWK